jgi:hypothetical protein
MSDDQQDQTDQTRRDAASTSDGTSGADDRAELKEALEKERKAARDAAKQIKDLQAKIAGFEDRDKSDAQKLIEERDALKAEREAAVTRARSKAGKAAALEAARTANALEPLAVYALIRDDLEYDDDDEPTNLDALLAKVRKSAPRLFQQGAGSGDGGRSSETVRDPNAAINAVLRRATGHAA